MKKTTLKDIADRLGFSQNSISVALRGGQGLNPETRKLILRTAQEMGYISRKRQTQPTKKILLVSAAATTGDPYFFNHLFVMIQEEISTLGYLLQSINTEYLKSTFSSQEHLIQFVETNSIAGILILGDIEESVCRMLAQLSLPIVGASFYHPGISMSCVIEDNFSGAYLLVHHLAELGYHKIGFIGNLNNVSFLERYSSFRGAATRLQLSHSNSFDILNIDGNCIDCLLQLEQRLKQAETLPEVFVCCNDQMAAMVLKALLNCGFHCPQDIAVVGFDNNEIAQLSNPTITSIDTSRNLQGSMSVQLLDDIINGRVMQDLRIVLPVRLNKGQSVKEYKAASI